MRETEAAARRLGLTVIADSLIVGDRNASIAEFAARNNLPAMGGERGLVAGGGLISYGGDFSEGWVLLPGTSTGS